MKAVEYFDKYKNRFFIPDGDTYLEATYEEDKITIRDLLLAMTNEAMEIAEERKAQKSSAFTAIVREQNQKWNAICRLFANHYGFSPLKHDGFHLYIENVGRERSGA